MTSIAAFVELMDRHPGRVIAAIAVLCAAAYTASLVIKPKPDGRIVIGDALHHSVQLRSAVNPGSDPDSWAVGVALAGRRGYNRSDPETLPFVTGSKSLRNRTLQPIRIG